MRALISGASGLVGSALTRSLVAGGHRVRRLVRRRPAGAGAAFWDPAAGELEASALGDVDAIVHRVLRRPALAPMPAALVRLIFGEMGEELLLAGARVAPARLEAAGYRFRHGDLEGALRRELDRDEDQSLK